MYKDAPVCFHLRRIVPAPWRGYRCPYRPSEGERMATTPQYVTQTEEGRESSLQEMAKRHLWMHFTRMSAYDHAEVPVLVKGDGCYVYDEHGKRYLDGLSALFCVNAGHGR